MTLPFGTDKETFEHSLLLVLCNRLVACLLAAACLMVSLCTNRSLKHWLLGVWTNGLRDFSLKLLCLPLLHVKSCSGVLDCPLFGVATQACSEVVCVSCLAALQVTRQGVALSAPWYSYAGVSLSNVAATSCQYEALKHVSFPVQTLGKCAKTLPVMAWGILMLRKTYQSRDFLLAALLSAGCTLFLLSGSTGSTRSSAASPSGALLGPELSGGMLMMGYLGLDGFTSSFQEKLFRGYRMTTLNQMLHVSAYSAAGSLAGEPLTVDLLEDMSQVALAYRQQVLPVVRPCIVPCMMCCLGPSAKTLCYGGLQGSSCQGSCSQHWLSWCGTPLHCSSQLRYQLPPPWVRAHVCSCLSCEARPQS